MDVFQADLHIHSVLSPCGSLEMSPVNIIATAIQQKLDIIGITDHNSTRHGPIVKKIGDRNGIFVLQGAEVTTREEIHCLTFFENEKELSVFQKYISDYLPFVQNNPEYFGFQVIVDEKENILEEIETLLLVGINQSIDEVAKTVRNLNGILIPAHIDRPRNGLLSQLGFMPDHIIPDAIEISGTNNKTHFLSTNPEFIKYAVIKSSDAHRLSQIGYHRTGFILKEISYNEIVMALHQEQGRGIVEL